MKKHVLLLALAGCSAIPLSAQAGDPCGAIMCMSQMGSSPKECKDSVQDFFDIICKKHGDFSGSCTAAKRRQKIMDQCPQADKQKREQILAKYGRVRYNPFKFY